MRNARHRKIDEIREGELGTAPIEPSQRRVSAEHRSDLEIDHLGCRDILRPETLARTVAIAAVVGERGREDGRVNDEHGRSEPRAWRT